MIDPGSERRQRLGEFLRVNRARLSPEAAGLPATRRRRTPGLRREEVAFLAGISATWYTRIEQGRDVTASHQALSRLADALQLGRAARRYLFELAGHHEPAMQDSATDAVPPVLAAAVAGAQGPAYLLDGLWTARAWNQPAATLFRHWLGGSDPNLLRYVFLDPSARAFIVDWEARARRLLAEFRADTAERSADPGVAELVARLRTGSPHFGRWWDEQQVLAREGGERAFTGPGGEVIRLSQLTLVPPIAPAFKLVLLLDPNDGP